MYIKLLFRLLPGLYNLKSHHNSWNYDGFYFNNIQLNIIDRSNRIKIVV